MIRRTVAAVILMCALGATPALGSTISLGVTSPVNAGSTFDVTVQVDQCLSGPRDRRCPRGVWVRRRHRGSGDISVRRRDGRPAVRAAGAWHADGGRLRAESARHRARRFLRAAHARHAALQRVARRRSVDRRDLGQHRSEPGPRVPRSPLRCDLCVGGRARDRVGPRALDDAAGACPRRCARRQTAATTPGTFVARTDGLLAEADLGNMLDTTRLFTTLLLQARQLHGRRISVYGFESERHKQMKLVNGVGIVVAAVAATLMASARAEASSFSVNFCPGGSWLRHGRDRGKLVVR